MSVELKKRSLRIGLKSGADPAVKTINFGNIKDPGDEALVSFAEAVAAITPPYGQTTPVRILVIERNVEVLEHEAARIAELKEEFFWTYSGATESDWENWMILKQIDYMHPLKEEYAAALALKDVFIRYDMERGYTAEEALKNFVSEYSNDLAEREAYWPIEREWLLEVYGGVPWYPDPTEEELRDKWLNSLGWGWNHWGPVHYEEAKA